MSQLKGDKKILMIVDAWFPLIGGGQIHVEEISKNLSKLGYKVTILTRNLGEWKERIEGVEVIRIGHFKEFANPLGRLEFLIICLGHVLIRSYDILHLHAFSPGLLTPFVKLLRPTKKIVFTVHGKGFKVAGFNISASILEDLVIYRIPYDVEITVAKSTLIKKTAAKKTVVIPNGVDIDRYKTAIRKRGSIKQILYVGRLSYEKGVDLLLNAFRNVSDKQIELVIVGTGPEENKLKHLAQGVKNVDFKGRLEGKELINEFRKADLLVLPSRTEGHPLVLFEGWASKLPVLATNVGDNEEYIKDGVNGFLCNPNVNSIKDKIQKIIQIKDLDKVVLKGSTEVSKYSWNEVALRTEMIYKSLL